MHSDDYGVVLDRLLELTAEALPEELAWVRLLALVGRARRRYLLEGYAAGMSVREEVDELVARVPSLANHQQFVIAMQCFAQLAEEAGDDADEDEPAAKKPAAKKAPAKKSPPKKSPAKRAAATKAAAKKAAAR